MVKLLNLKLFISKDLFTASDNRSKRSNIRKKDKKQECIPVGCVPPAAVAVREEGLPQCMLGYTPWVCAWRSPWVCAWRPPRCGPGDLPGCGPGDPPGGPGDPLGCGPRDPLARPFNFPPLDVGLETCKACWDTTPLETCCEACWDTTQPPVNRMIDRQV